MAGRVTAVRLELLTDDTLPHKGPGRQDNGNLHLSEFKLTAAGVVDTTFGNQSITLGNGFAHTNDTVPGQFRLDIQETGATPRALAVLDDGKL
ncbi:MAG: hypothetical protein ABMA15_30120, partial [Vicinamibacterales bacterium]